MRQEVINRHDEPGAGRPIDSWILDVCLDYYTTRNPFLDALGEALRAEGGWGEPEVAAARATVRDFYDGPRSGWSQCGRGLSSVKEEVRRRKDLVDREIQGGRLG